MTIGSAIAIIGMWAAVAYVSSLNIGAGVILGLFIIFPTFVISMASDK